MRKYVALLLVALLAISSLMMVRLGSSQITKPSTPEFTIQDVAYPYDVPTTYSTDPYTGQNITHPGYHVENKSRVLVIKNQPFTPYVSNGSEVQLYYQVRYKGHFSDNDDWYEVYHLPNYPVQSNSEYTTISPNLNIQSLSASTNGAKIDFQVQALIGSIYLVEARLYGGANYWTFEGEKSDWSSTQTITVELPDPSSVPSQTPTASVLPSQNPILTPDQAGPQTVAFLGLDWLQIAIVALLSVIAVLLVLVVVFLRRRALR